MIDWSERQTIWVIMRAEGCRFSRVWGIAYKWIGSLRLSSSDPGFSWPIYGIWMNENIVIVIKTLRVRDRYLRYHAQAILFDFLKDKLFYIGDKSVEELLFLRPAVDSHAKNTRINKLSFIRVSPFSCEHFCSKFPNIISKW